MNRSKLWWASACAVLSVFVAPTETRATGKSVWNIIQEYTVDFEQLVLLSGYTPALSECGPNSPRFTAFIPLDQYVASYFRDQKMSIADVAGTPALAEQFVADHVVNGQMIPVDLVSPNIVFLQTWSGRNLVKEKLTTSGTAEVGVNVAVNGQFIIYYHHACNGVVYFLYGDTYGRPSVNVAGRTTVEPANLAGAPRGATRPERPDFYSLTPETSDLPDTI